MTPSASASTRLRPRSLAYLGTPAMSVPPLQALHAAGFDIRLVVTNPDRRRGRGSATQPSPVKEAATALGIPVSHEVDDVLTADVELGVVVAFGQIIRPHVLVNPRIVESDGEWSYEEGCLSIPGLSFEIIRPKVVHLVGLDLEGNEVSVEADELTARLFQHELDHLDGVLMTERMDPDTKKRALKEIRRIAERVEGPRERAGFFS